MGKILDMRRTMGSREVLPKGIVPIEYLESMGTQWIDTMVYINSQNNSIAAMFMGNGVKVINNDYVFFGCGYGYDNKNIELYSGGGAKDTISCGYGGYSFVPLNYVAKFIVTFNDGSYMFYDEYKSVLSGVSFTPKKTFTTPYTMNIFSLHRNGIYKTTKPVRCYYFQIYDNDVLVRDFIPVRVGQVGYMYDKVSGQLFGNAGTGEFILGADKVGGG